MSKILRNYLLSLCGIIAIDSITVLDSVRLDLIQINSSLDRIKYMIENYKKPILRNILPNETIDTLEVDTIK